MIKLFIEKRDRHVLLTVPPVGDKPALENALASGRMGYFDFWERLSETEEAVLELPLKEWKWLLSGLLWEYRVRLGLRAAKALGLRTGSVELRTFLKQFVVPDALRLSFLLEGTEYDDVASLPHEADLHVDVGTFVLTHPVLRVSDPAYLKDDKGVFTLEAVPGKWRAQALLEDDGPRGFCVARLTVLHESLEAPVDYTAFERQVAGYAEVDSAQCGFFDDARYPDDESEFVHEEGTFYHSVCETLTSTASYGRSEFTAGIVADGSGAASCTFLGDGRYPCRVLRNAEGRVVGAYLWYTSEQHPFFTGTGGAQQETAGIAAGGKVA
jgi:hypothetical protein